jgi:ATP-binding cassette, subfamily B, bacterial
MSTYRDTLAYIKPIVFRYKWMFFGIFILHAFRITLSAVITPIFYKRIIDIITKGGPDRTTLSGPLYHSIFLIVILFPAAWIFGRATQYFISKFQSAVIKDLHDFSFKKLHGHSYSFFADHFGGSLVSKSRKFVRAFEAMHDITVDRFWTCIVFFITIFIVFYIQAPSIAYIFLGMCVVYIAIVILMSREKYEYDVADAVADSRVTGYLADSITNSLAIKSSSALSREVKSFAEVTATDATARLRAWFFGNKINAIQTAVSMTAQIAITFLTGYLWLTGRITAGLFVLVQSYSNTVGNNFWELGNATTRFTKYMSDMKEMVDIFRQIPDVLDPKHPEPCRIKEGNIEIKNMFFRYETNPYVFDNFSMQIKAGEKVGLVGHSGSGKSTITKLIMRFIDISDGEILIDGQNISKIKQDDLRGNISYISQEPILFHRSIEQNIAYSYPAATKEEIIDSAKKAHAHEFITNLKHGYDTLVGERGVKLSGGERQRVAIARAMLKNSPILILDEATSSLDSISESYIQEAFSELMQGKTTLVIAHRLSTVQKMDRIIVLDKGKIVEEGTHKELLAKEGAYADLWNHQTGGFLE